MADDPDLRRLRAIFPSTFFNNFNIHDMNYSYQFYFFVFETAQSSQEIMTDSYAMFSFAIPILLNFLVLKYQNLGKSPFDTHPKTLLSGILSLLLYSYTYSYGAYQRRLHVHRRPSSPAAGIFRRCTLFFGYMGQACLASLLFPDSASPAFYVLYATVSVGDDLLYLLYKWILFLGQRKNSNYQGGVHLLPL